MDSINLANRCALRRWFEPRVSLVWLSALLLLAPASLRAGDLSGRIILRQDMTGSERVNANPYPGMLGTLSEAPVSSAADAREVVVSLHGVAVDNPVYISKTPELRQINQNFEPRVVAIPVGTTVEFPNMDPIFHNVFSYSKAKRFDLGRYGKGKSESVTFDKAGLVKVFCELHANMQAFVYIVDSTWIAQPDEDGNFRFEDVPNGTYELRVWHPERGSMSQDVTIEQGTTTFELTI